MDFDPRITSDGEVLNLCKLCLKEEIERGNEREGYKYPRLI